MSKQMWSAPCIDQPIHGTVVVPGSKSISNRALVLAAISREPCTISNLLVARDSALMIDALGALGIGIDQLDRNSVRVTPHNLRGPTHIDCGLAGTLMRFLPPLAATADGDIEFDGDEGARRRPMATTIESLRALGVAVSDAGSASLPFTVHGDGVVPGGSVELDASASSQFVSGLLLSAPRFENGITVRHRGESVPSLPHIEMTVAMLQEAGAEVRSDVEDPTNARWTVRPGVINLGDFVVEPDLSNAAAFLGAAMVTAGSVTVPTWPTKTTQAGDQIRDVFAEMGGSCVLDDAGLTVTGPERMVGIDIDLRDIGELTPTIAAVAVFAQTPSKLRGVAHLRGHETNRLAALVTEINRLGGQAEELADGLTITPRRLTGASIATYHDHRMATFGAIVGLRVPGTTVENIGTTAKTMPEFAQMWTALVRGDGAA
ncbi:MAG TPA: 3-phosphoshikimate 1-carboxyvinyltransferase [Actinobacteria bacterium]|nr:3-phosphoshikimate 1-carboxyvinyltransferase [Actinomycetota bacterium]